MPNATLAVVPIEAFDATAGEPQTAKPGGKGISWTEDENVTLARAASIVCTDPVVGSGMTVTEMNEKIRSQFIGDLSKPKEACTTRDKVPLDCRRWDGRSIVAYGKQWEVIRRECTKSKGCLESVYKMKPTGNPSDKDLQRCASLLYSDGSLYASHIYDCIRNPSYHIAKRFKFEKTYEFLSSNTAILEARGIDVEEKKKSASPIGTKAAKKLKDAKRNSDGSNEKPSMVESIQRIENMLTANAANRQQISLQQLAFHGERMEWEIAKTLLGPGSNASNEERDAIGAFLRERLFVSLSGEVENDPPGKRHCGDNQENGSVGAAALLKVSTVSDSPSNGDVSTISNGGDGEES